MKNQQHRRNGQGNHSSDNDRDLRGRFTSNNNSDSYRSYSNYDRNDHQDERGQRNSYRSQDEDSDYNSYNRSNQGQYNNADWSRNNQNDYQGNYRQNSNRYENSSQGSYRNSGDDSFEQFYPRNEYGNFSGQNDRNDWDYDSGRTGGRNDGQDSSWSAYRNSYQSIGNNNQSFDQETERDQNAANRQSNRGKGPKGYTRSDDRIKEDVNQKLSDDHQLDASELEVEVQGGEVTLSGTVSSREDKRRAEDLVESVSGVNNVENKIRVDRNSNQSESTDSSDSTQRKSTGSSEKSKTRNPVTA